MTFPLTQTRPEREKDPRSRPRDTKSLAPAGSSVDRVRVQEEESRLSKMVVVVLEGGVVCERDCRFRSTLVGRDMVINKDLLGVGPGNVCATMNTPVKGSVSVLFLKRL